ncbi:hypothetical protein ACFSM5_08525 [Lacibacterium aquatile]|uniref:YtxH domain-containing protein n=1 Tax=Lacibacterium aquatile TaxID=1168082 RepID=A0ABW5DR58_9PROT
MPEKDASVTKCCGGERIESHLCRGLRLFVELAAVHDVLFEMQHSPAKEEKMRSQNENGSQLLAFCAGAVVGIAGLCLYRSAKGTIDALPAGASTADALKAINPAPEAVRYAKTAVAAVQKAATDAKDRFNKGH